MKKTIFAVGLLSSLALAACSSSASTPTAPAAPAAPKTTSPSASASCSKARTDGYISSIDWASDAEAGGKKGFENAIRIIGAGALSQSIDIFMAVQTGAQAEGLAQVAIDASSLVSALQQGQAARAVGQWNSAQVDAIASAFIAVKQDCQI